MTNSELVAKTRIRLRGFEKPDTGSQLEGLLDPGDYIVKEYRQGYPDSNTDYALVLAPALGAGDTWICSRWQDQHYAEVVEHTPVLTPRLDFDTSDFAITENQLVGSLPSFAEFTYDRDEARYPGPLRGVNVPQVPPAFNNCCTFVEALVVGAWTDAYPDFEWSRERHAQMMILSNDDYYSPVTAAVESNMAVSVADPDVTPHSWTLVQGWRQQWRGGHTFIIVDYHEDTDRVLTLESNSAYKLDGCGFRGIGNLRDTNNRPPDNWWEIDGLWTWERIRATYRFRQQAWLKVNERGWSGLA